MWADNLFNLIIDNTYTLDYPIYFDIINSLPDFYEGNSLHEYCKGIEKDTFVNYLKGMFVLDLNSSKKFLPFYNQLGKGGIPEWSYNVFNFDFELQDSITQNQKLNEETKKILAYDVLSPSVAITLGEQLKNLIPKTGSYEIMYHINDIVGYPELMPFEVDYHKIANLSNWFINWGKAGHYFFSLEKGINLSLKNNNVL